MIILWDDEPGGNVEHIDEHGLSIEDVEHVVANAEAASRSHATGRPCLFGYTPDGRYVIVIYDEIDDETIMPATAYEVPEP